jgi:arylsulfatase A-like enzyme/thiamine biosynthesis lipoprotein ApbE
MAKNALLPLYLLAACSGGASTSVETPPSFYELTEPAMGTNFRLAVYGEELATIIPAVEAAMLRVHALDALLSDYSPDSEVSRLAEAAKTARPDEWISISPELAAVLTSGLEIAQSSEGAFDPTLGRLTKLWRRSKRQAELPSPMRLAEARAASGHSSLEFDPKQPALRFLVPGIELDLGGIAKGYACDEALRIITQAGLKSALVDGGGDILVSGPPPGQPEGWHISIDPGYTGVETMNLIHCAVATSGDRYQAVAIDGVRYAHIIDPATGLGLTRMRSATIIARTAMEADALASAACVLGPDRVGLVSNRPGVTAITVDNPQLQVRQPNILFILADDLGWADLGVQGSNSYRTPALDRLASEGMRFTHAYAAAANCAPTRATLMTGQSISVHGMYTVGSGKRGKAADRTMEPPTNVTEIPSEVVTLAESLQSAGYRTGHFGKWHLGSAANQTGPLAQGFEINIGGYQIGHPPSYFWPYHKQAADGTLSQQLPGLEAGSDGEYLTDRLTSEALSFLRADDGRPWFLYLPHYAVHTPIQAPEAQTAAVNKRGLEGRQVDAKYTAMVQILDQNCGRLLQWLEDHDQIDNTLVIFTSDNGGYGGYLDAGIDQADITHNYPLKGGKGMLSEGGLRVPLIVRWPAAIAPGQVNDTPVHTLDFYPTLLAAAGVDCTNPQAEHMPPQELEGRDLAPLWMPRDEEAAGRPSNWQERALYFHMPGYLEARRGSWRATPAGAIRRGRWKLIEPFDGKPVELYDLVADPGESTNLAESEAKQRDSLLKQLQDWRADRNAPMPSPLNG